jgi:hypothetical protein
MANTALTPSYLCNIALVAAFDVQAPFNTVELNIRHGLADDGKINFRFGDCQKLNKPLLEVNAHSRAYDTTFPSDGTEFCMELPETLLYEPSDSIKQTIGVLLSNEMFNRSALRAAG